MQTRIRKKREYLVAVFFELLTTNFFLESGFVFLSWFALPPLVV
jgi:hypothetical protein